MSVLSVEHLCVRYPGGSGDVVKDVSLSLEAGEVLRLDRQDFLALLKAPLVAEVYGPDEAGRIRTAEQVLKAFGDTAHIVGIDSTLAADAPRAWLRVNRQRAETLGIPVATIAQTVNAALSGAEPAWLHDGQSKYPVPVRLQLPTEQQVGLEALLALPLRSGSGQLVPLSELVRIERGVIDKPRYTKDLQPLVYVLGDVGERAAAGECDLVAKSSIGPLEVGWLYNNAGLFLMDRRGRVPVSIGLLRAAAESGSTEVTFTCMPPGSGVRGSIDCDSNGQLDGDERDSGQSPCDG